MLEAIPDSTKRIFTAIGYLSVYWATVEFAIDHIIRFVHEEYGGKAIQKIPPISYNKKPEYLRKAFAAHSDLTEFKPWLERLLKEANEIAEQRKWCLHGVIVSDEPDQPFSLRKLIHGVEYRDAHRPFTVEQIEKLGTRALVLGMNLTFLGIHSVGVIPKDEADQLFRQILSQNGAVLPEGKLFG